MCYHLCKQSRMYRGEGYDGPTRKSEEPIDIASLEEAKRLQLLYQKRNPVGWNIYDADTEKLVDGLDFFEE
jgi:hypothetical protein